MMAYEISFFCVTGKIIVGTPSALKIARLIPSSGSSIAKAAISGKEFLDLSDSLMVFCFA
jgi:hypothetical protein